MQTRKGQDEGLIHLPQVLTLRAENNLGAFRVREWIENYVEDHGSNRRIRRPDRTEAGETIAPLVAQVSNLLRRGFLIRKLGVKLTLGRLKVRDTAGSETCATAAANEVHYIRQSANEYVRGVGRFQ